jgi:hypothetical protein
VEYRYYSLLPSAAAGLILLWISHRPLWAFPVEKDSFCMISEVLAGPKSWACLPIILGCTTVRGRSTQHQAKQRLN